MSTNTPPGEENRHLWSTALLVASFFTVWSLAAADLTQAAVSATPENAVPVHAFAYAVLHLLALVVPLALALASGAALLAALVRVTPWLASFAQRFSSWQAFTAHDPEAFASAVGALAGLAASVMVLGASFVRVAEAVHRMDLGGVLIGAIALGVAFAGVAIAAFVRWLVRPLAGVLRRVASAAGAAVLVVAAAAGALATILVRFPELGQTYGITRLIAAPATLLFFLLCIPTARALMRRTRHAGRFVASVSLLALVGFGVSVVTYGQRQSVRGVIEERTFLGRPLARGYARLADRDRDGYSALFGGHDCNDAVPSIHPGARDEPGDGIDSDCFDGDGAVEAVASGGDGAYGATPPGLPRHPNFLVVTIDALRPDVLETQPPLMPNLARIAGEGVRFRTTIAQSSRSIRSIPSFWTGLYPSQIAYGAEFVWPSIEQRNRLVAEDLARVGYRTSAVIGTNYFARSNGFLQGFEHRDFDGAYQPPPRGVVDRAIAELTRLSSGQAPFLLWLHLFTVHGPHPHVHVPEADTDPEPYRLTYDATTTLADTELGRLFAVLDANLELRKDTVLIVASDHGESIYEHGVLGHASTLYDSEVLSTLFVRAEGIAPAVRREPVALMDVAPTILNFAHVPVPEPVPARSLVPALLGGPLDPERPLVSELLPDGHFPYDIKSLRQGRYKLHWWVRDGRYALYDLESDPNEQRDISDDQPDVAQRLLGRLRAFMSADTRELDVRADMLRQHVRRTPFSAPTNPVDIAIPGVGRMTGFDLPRRTYRRGETIPLRLFFHVDHETSRDLYFDVVALGPGDRPVAQSFHGSHFPVFSQYRSESWQAGDYIEDPLGIVVPPEMEAPLRTSFVFWISDRGQRVRFLVDGQSVGQTTLFEVEVE